MMLLTKADRAKLPPLHSQDEVPDPEVRIKFFCPWNDWVWLATEGSGVAYVKYRLSKRDDILEPLTREATSEEIEILCSLWQDTKQRTFPLSIGEELLAALGSLPGTGYVLEDFKFFGYIHGHFDELGYFTLKELKSLHGPGVWSALGIERDLHFRPAPLSKVLADYTKSRGWRPTWTPGST